MLTRRTATVAPGATTTLTVRPQQPGRLVSLRLMAADGAGTAPQTGVVASATVAGASLVDDQGDGGPVQTGADAGTVWALAPGVEVGPTVPVLVAVTNSTAAAVTVILEARS